MRVVTTPCCHRLSREKHSSPALQTAHLVRFRLVDRLDDLAFPGITYRVGASREPTPVIRGTGIRVQTIVIAVQVWGESTAQVAEEYELGERQVTECLAFYAAHRAEVDAAIEAEEALASREGPARASSPER